MEVSQCDSIAIEARSMKTFYAIYKISGTSNITFTSLQLDPNSFESQGAIQCFSCFRLKLYSNYNFSEPGIGWYQHCPKQGITYALLHIIDYQPIIRNKGIFFLFRDNIVSLISACNKENSRLPLSRVSSALFIWRSHHSIYLKIYLLPKSHREMHLIVH